MELASRLRAQAVAMPAVSALSAPEREAAAFAYALEHLPIGLHPEKPIAGDWGWQFAVPGSAGILAGLFGAGKDAGEPRDDPEPTVLQLLDERFHCRAGWTPAHTCADYQRVIERGLGAVLAEIEGALETAEGEPGATLLGMWVGVQAVIGFARRFAELAEAQGLAEMAAICRKVPEHPAETVREALQAIWLVHGAIGLSEYCDASLSLGRLDQYLYPLFETDLRRGVPLAELRGLLVDLWRKLNRFGDPACAVNLGGLDAEGRDVWNPLTDLLVEVTREVRLPAPILAARVHDALPAEAWELLLTPELLTIGQPTFYGERACRETMVRRGVPEGEAHGFSVNSCMGLVMAGQEISDMWGGVMNMLLPLELALNHGQGFRHEMPLALETVPQIGYADFNELYTQWERYLDDLVAFLIAEQAEATQWVGRERPNPFFSALTGDCLARGKDRALGGARYHCVVIEGFGWANVADTLTAIKRLVFAEQRYTQEELVAAAQADFAGHEDLLADLKACPKYGNADPEADAMAARVTDTFAALVTRHSHDNLHYLPSYHTLNAHIWAGAKLGASLDGRRAGRPLGKNIGPCPENRTGSLTALLLSASTVDQRSLPGGQALDISVDPKLLTNPEDRRKLQAALLTYFDRGGLQVQVNGLGAAELREAIADPQAHRDLIVRIAGYSAQFTQLGQDVQEEMVERFEAGL